MTDAKKTDRKEKGRTENRTGEREIFQAGWGCLENFISTPIKNEHGGHPTQKTKKWGEGKSTCLWVRGAAQHQQSTKGLKVGQRVRQEPKTERRATEREKKKNLELDSHKTSVEEPEPAREGEGSEKGLDNRSPSQRIITPAHSLKKVLIGTGGTSCGDSQNH